MKKNVELGLFKKKTKIQKIIWRKRFGKLFSKIKNDVLGDGTWPKGGRAKGGHVVHAPEVWLDAWIVTKSCNGVVGLIGAKICALMAHIRYDLCTKGHSNHPTWPKSMLRP